MFTLNPSGLRRFRAALGAALFKIVPIYCVGDSLTYGQGGDDNTGNANNIPDNTQGWVGQLRSLFAKTYGDPGEGYLFCFDSRAVITGALNGVTTTEYSGPLKRAYRHQSGQKTVITVPATGVAYVSVIQPNKTGDVSLTWQKNTVAQGNVATMTNTGTPIVTDIPVTGGDVIEVDGPASGNAYLAGWIFKSATPSSGVRVHRIGQGGNVIGDMIGGTNNGTPKYTSAQQAQAIQSHYNFDGTGLVVVSFGVNDQVFQGGGGTTYQNNITPAVYQTLLQQVCTQATADGHCVLILGEPRNGGGLGSPGTEADYQAARQAVTLATDHVACIEISDIWGTTAQSQALGLTVAGTAHPKQAGHGDMARTVYRAVTVGDSTYF
jgi:lysophospholipase L1-like esterase